MEWMGWLFFGMTFLALLAILWFALQLAWEITFRG